MIIIAADSKISVQAMLFTMFFMQKAELVNRLDFLFIRKNFSLISADFLLWTNKIARYARCSTSLSLTL
jgi:hypothetical protein